MAASKLHIAAGISWRQTIMAAILSVAGANARWLFAYRGAGVAAYLHTAQCDDISTCASALMFSVAARKRCLRAAARTSKAHRWRTGAWRKTLTRRRRAYPAGETPRQRSGDALRELKL